MIFHILPAHAYHLSKIIVESIIQHTKIEGTYIIYGDSKYKSQYADLFKTYKNNTLYYCVSQKELKTILNNKDSCIIQHARNRKLLMFFVRHRYKNVSYVSWGGDFFKKNNIAQKIKECLKIVMFSYYRSIVALNPIEFSYFKNILHQKIVFNIPYLISSEQNVDLINTLWNENSVNKFKITDRVKVYLGNNGSRINTYFQLLDDLYHLKDKIEIHCMIHYCLTDNVLFDKLTNKAAEMYGDKCIFHMNTYSYKDYIKFMNHCDVYICYHKDGQTGIGAILNCLFLGKKVFIAGVNYNYITSLGFLVEKSDNVKNYSIDQLIFESAKNRELNHKIAYGLRAGAEAEKISQQWDNYYKYALNQYK